MYCLLVANLCLILEREFEAGPAAAEQTRWALSELLGRDGSLSELVLALDEQLKGSETSEETQLDSKAREIILADVERRLAIDRPGYAS